MVYEVLAAEATLQKVKIIFLRSLGRRRERSVTRAVAAPEGDCCFFLFSFFFKDGGDCPPVF